MVWSKKMALAGVVILGESRPMENRIGKKCPDGEEKGGAMFRGKQAGLIVLAGIGVAFGSKASGAAVPISYSEQDRSVSAVATDTGSARGGTISIPETVEHNDSQTAPNFSAFGGGVAAEATLGPQSAGSEAQAVQESSLSSTGFSDSGEVVTGSVVGGNGRAGALASSVFQITFNVAQAIGYTFDASVIGASNPALMGTTEASITLTTKAGKNVFAPVTSVKLSDFVEKGTLEPGTYTFSFDTEAATGVESQDSVTYSVSLLDGPVPAAVSVISSSSIPLPSSGLAATVMLSGLGIAGFVRRRRAVWAMFPVR
jgi:hypothetical protein